jgi:hypothetical protein
MAAMFESGHIVDLIMIIMAIEAGLLVLIKSWAGLGLSPREAASVLLPGLGLLLALRAALAGQHWTIIALFLIASFVAHLVDLRLRINADVGARKAP